MNLPAPMTDPTKNPSDARNRLHCRERFVASVATTDADLDLASEALWLAAEDARDSTNEEVSLLREHLERVRHLAAAPN
jgi:hypothetical protein